MKREILFDPSLVFYLPLWKRDGASIMSDDAYGHLCTATGALWTPEGRDFNGSSDEILCGNGTSLQITGPMTVMVWFKAASVDADLIGKWGADGQRSWEVGLRTATTTFGGSVTTDGTSATRTTASKGAYTPNAWNCAFFAYDGTNIYVDVNGTKGADVAYSSGIFNSTTQVRLGTLMTGGWLAGTVGEVAIWHRGLFLPERANIRLATKWRYR